MARLRKFIRHPLPEELANILRERFQGAKITLNGSKIGRSECYHLDVRYPGPDAADLLRCLQMLTYTYGNIGFCFDGRPPSRRSKGLNAPRREL